MYKNHFSRHRLPGSGQIPISFPDVKHFHFIAAWPQEDIHDDDDEDNYYYCYYYYYCNSNNS